VFVYTLMAALSPGSPAQSAPSQKTLQRPLLERTKYLGFAAYRLSNGHSEAVVVPALGRIMRYGLVGGQNLLWNAVPAPAKAGEWRNWGGDKSWPAPQNRWPLSIGHDWPPHPSWDGNAYQAEVLPGGRLRIRSGVWPRFGCRVIRDFSFSPHGDFEVTQTYEKVSGPPVELAIWSITQLATPEAIFIPANAESTYKNGFHWLTKSAKPTDVTLVRPDLLRIRPSGADTNKIGVDATSASIVTVTRGLAFQQKAAKPQGNYPDGAQGSGFPTEVFDIGGTGKGHYMETELLSPLRLFYVGSSWTHTVRWSLHPLMNKSVDSAALMADVASLF
jgi:hypothetical protein